MPSNCDNVTTLGALSVTPRPSLFSSVSVLWSELDIPMSGSGAPSNVNKANRCHHHRALPVALPSEPRSDIATQTGTLSKDIPGSFAWGNAIKSGAPCKKPMGRILFLALSSSLFK